MGRTGGLPSAAELADRLTRRVEEEIDGLKGVALIRAWVQVEELRRKEREQPEATEQADVLDVVANAELPVERKVALLEAEWDRLMQRIGDVARAIEAITGTQKEIDDELRARNDPAV